MFQVIGVATAPAAKYNRVATTPNDLTPTYTLFEVEERLHSVKEGEGVCDTLVYRRVLQ